MSSNIHNIQIPKLILSKIKLWNTLTLCSFLILVLGWYVALFVVGADKEQGNVYRIMFVHVPVAWCAFFWMFIGAFWGVCTLALKKKSESFDLSSQAAIETGSIYAALVLITGSIWGKATWGVWWDWDPRLTSSLVMFLVAGAYLLFRHSTTDLLVKRKMSAVIAILCAFNVPIVYYSVNIWRSLHQPQTFIQSSKNASSDVTYVLFFNFLAMTFFSFCLYQMRRQSISAQYTLDQARRNSDDGG